jgi:hypothetical protein
VRAGQGHYTYAALKGSTDTTLLAPVLLNLLQGGFGSPALMLICMLI